MTVMGLRELESTEREGGRMGKELEIAEKSFVPFRCVAAKFGDGGLGRNQSMNKSIL